MSVIEVKNLKKNYGRITAVRGVSFSVNQGEIFGLIGPNGAGKTTILRIIATLLKISEGSVSIMGFDCTREADEIRKIISYLPEDAGAYKNLSGIQYLRFISNFFDTQNKQAMIQRGVEIADLGDRINDRVDTYSKGMMRRLLVGRALMINPKLAILDEPTSGLDVINAQQIRKIIQTTAKNGTTILLSSHNMLEVEFLCDRIALITDGRIVEEGTPKSLLQKYAANNIEDVFVKVVKP
ncbi:MAG: ABC transporter ATP-binding protein [Candidatus Thermoplasmatota archaeon]